MRWGCEVDGAVGPPLHPPPRRRLTGTWQAYDMEKEVLDGTPNTSYGVTEATKGLQSLAKIMDIVGKYNESAIFLFSSVLCEQ